MWDNGTTITIGSSEGWDTRQISDNHWEVYRGDEVHKTMTYRGAYFLKNMFTEQDQWFRWGRYGINNTITLSSSDNVGIGFHNPPQANVKLSFGDSAQQEYSTYFQFYVKNPPNRIQRWLLAKTFGMKMVILK